MTGTIIKISPYKKSHNENSYLMVEFKMAKDGSWARTFLCPDYRNFKHWKPYLKIGKVLCGLKMESESLVDADSIPMPVDPKGLGKSELTDLENLAKQGAFG